MARARMTIEHWEQLTHWPLIAASLLWLVAYSWKVIAARICCRPPTTRLATKSRIAAASGVENGAVP